MGLVAGKLQESHSYERSLEIVWSEHYSSKLKQITNKKNLQTLRESESRVEDEDKKKGRIAACG